MLSREDRKESPQKATADEVIELLKGPGTYEILLLILICYAHNTTIVSLFAMMVAGIVLPGDCRNFTESLSFSNNCTWPPKFNSLVHQLSLSPAEQYLPALISTLQFVGGIPAAPIFGYLSDKYGRRTMLLVAMAGQALFGFGSAFSPNWQLLLFFRILLGAVVYGCYTAVSFVYIVEHMRTSYRLTAETLLDLFYGSAYAYAALVAWLVRSWFWLTIIGSIQPAIGFFILLWFSESPRWLAKMGKEAEAEKAFQRISRTNRKDPNLLPKRLVQEVTPSLPASSVISAAQLRTGIRV